MELGGGGGGFWELSSAFNQSPSTVSFPQHEPVVLQSGVVAHPHYYHHDQVFGAGEGGDGGGGLPAFAMVEPHLTCLKLGKRHYFEDCGERRFPVPPPAILLGGKRGKGFVGGGGSSSSVPVARCQVEGCNLPLVNAKEYHRRHKVCEMHSKAPKVVVLGMEQRFCQQCSRFHVVSEFDDSKRSCRRRLAGHNERRRKNSNEATGKNLAQDYKTAGDRFQFIPSSPKGRALSLLSSKTYPTSTWDSSSSSDLSLLSSAALRELIAENRAAILARQLVSHRSWPPQVPDHAASSQQFFSEASSQHAQHQLVPESAHDWSQFHAEPAHVQVTLDLMQAPTSSFPLVPGRSKPKESEECCDIWKSLVGTHVV